MKKRGFFFSMDAFLALLLFAVVLSLIYSFFISVPRLDQPFYFSEDVLDVFSKVKIKDLDLNQYPGIESMVNDGTISNTDKTLFEILAELQLSGNGAGSQSLIEDILICIIPDQYGFGIDFGDTEIYTKDDREIISLIARQRLVIA